MNHRAKMVDLKHSFHDNIKRCWNVHTGLLIWGKSHLIQRFTLLTEDICPVKLFSLSIIALFFLHFGKNIFMDSKCKHYIPLFLPNIECRKPFCFRLIYITSSCHLKSIKTSIMIIKTYITGYTNIAYDRKRVSLTLHLNLHCLKIH